MARFFQLLADARKRRRQIKIMLSQNAVEFDNIMEQIQRDQRNELAEIMNQYVKDVIDTGDIDGELSDGITAEAERKCEHVRMLAEQRIEEAKQANKRRINQILSASNQ